MSKKTEGDGQTLALVTLDRLDDDLIIAELQGRAVTTWAYKFTQDGQEVTGLSISGVEQACRESGRHGEAIRILRHEWRETEDAFYGTVEAARFLVAEDGREMMIDTAIGAKREPKSKWSSKRRGWYTDQFAFEKAISKAARNAKGKLLDDSVKAATIAAAISAGRTRQVTAREIKGVDQAAERETEPPATGQVKGTEARRRFFAAAEEMGHKDPAAIHAALRLKCRGQGDHDDDDPAACHMLSAAIRYLEGQGNTMAQAWEFMLGRLEPASPFDEVLAKEDRQGGADVTMSEEPAS